MKNAKGLILGISARTAIICSNHFSSKDSFYNLKDELLSDKDKRILLWGVDPTLNLPYNSRPSVSAINRKNKLEAKLSKQVNINLILI